jgi:hypothetical protein
VVHELGELGAAGDAQPDRLSARTSGPDEVLEFTNPRSEREILIDNLMCDVRQVELADLLAGEVHVPREAVDDEGCDYVAVVGNLRAVVTVEFVGRPVSQLCVPGAAAKGHALQQSIAEARPGV